MKTRFLTAICLALTLVTFGCDKKDDHGHDQAEAEAPADEASNKEAAQEASKGAKEEAKKDEPLPKVELAEAGSTFDPAVQAEQLPAGAWYCDMGTVHWAGEQKPEDGKCPECGMKLKQHDPEQLAAQEEKAVEPHDHDDHAHEGDEHGHGEKGHAHGEEGHAHGDDHGHAH